MKYRLEDVCIKVTDGSHFSPKDDKESNIPMLSVKDMLEFAFDYKNCKHISMEDYKTMIHQDCVPKKYDILVAKDGSYLKEIFVNEEEEQKAVLSSIAIFRPNTEIINPYFLCYLLKTPSVMKYTKENCVSGSALPRIILKAFKDIELEIPEIQVQNKIVNIIKNINDKIILNNKINNNLLGIGKILFNESFDIKNIKKKKLAEVCFEITRGYTKKYVEKSNIINLNQKVNKGENLDKQYFKYLDENQNIPKNRFVKKGDILLNSLGQGTLGRIHLYKEDIDNIVIDQHITIIRADNKQINSYYLYYLLTSKEYQNELEGLVTGTTGMQMLNISAVRELKIPIPNKEKIDVFGENVKWMFEKINSNNLENENLVKLRDTLLPKLMNGEIDLDKIEI